MLPPKGGPVMLRRPLPALLALLVLQLPGAFAASPGGVVASPPVRSAPMVPAPRSQPPEAGGGVREEDGPHHGRLMHAFLHHAALVMGTSPHALQAEILRRGLPETLQAHGLTRDSLIDRMVKDVVSRSKEGGHPIDEARTRDLLTRIYEALTTPPAS